MEDGKKISFAFSKIIKKPSLGVNTQITKRKIQLIDCLESQTIKLKDAVEKVYTPRVIPMTTSDSPLIQLKKRQLKKEVVDARPDSELTADELAARELLREAHSSLIAGDSKAILTLPVAPDGTIEIEDKEEPTLDDYESVPIREYGKAMLRGMGWNEGSGIGKKTNITNVKKPTLRPKGMGLGANIVVNKKIIDTNEQEIFITKGGFGKIIEGKHKGHYCEIQGFDDEAGRIIVKTSIQGLILAVNEFLVIPVTKEEYVQSSRVINIAKYEEYKNRESGHSGSSTGRSQKSNKNSDSYKTDKTSNRYNGKHRNSYSSEENSYKMKQKHKERYKNSDSDSGKEYHTHKIERKTH